MNKLVKGSIAGAAGIALLLGGAGTFALWNSTATVNAQTITAGSLSLVANHDGVWKQGTATITPATYKIVPGTTLEFTQTLTVTAVGDGLKANLTHSGLTPAGGLSNLTKETLSVTSSAATIDGNTMKFNAGTSTVNVKVTVEFPADSTGGQTESLNLSAITFTLTQTV
jgi:alternate signal-mediated exported protein